MKQENELLIKAETLLREIGAINVIKNYRIKGAQVADAVGFIIDEAGELKPEVIVEVKEKFTPTALEQVYQLATKMEINHLCVITPKTETWYKIVDKELVPAGSPPKLKSNRQAKFDIKNLWSLLDFLRSSSLTEENIRDLVADILLIHFYRKEDPQSSSDNYIEQLEKAEEKLIPEFKEISKKLYEHIDKNYLLDITRNWDMFDIDSTTVVNIFDSLFTGKRDSGVFYTPQPLRNLMSNMIELMNHKNNVDIIDPACSYAGLLESTVNTFPGSTGYGIEINFKIARIAAIVALASKETLKIFNKDAFTITGKDQYPKNYDVVCAVPPFATKISSRDKYKPLLSDRATSNGDILWLSLIVELAKPGGVISVLVPEGVLFSSHTEKQSLRTNILKECCLEGIVSLPQGVFYSTSIKTSILFLRRKGTPDIFQHNQVFVAEIQDIKEENNFKKIINDFSTYQKDVKKTIMKSKDPNERGEK